MKHRNLCSALFWGIFLTATVYPVYVEGLVSCSPNPCKNGASCVTNPKGESYCKTAKSKKALSVGPFKNSLLGLEHGKAHAGLLKTLHLGNHLLVWLQTFRC
ncbi:neurogenic locus Notch protein [Caerostris darwini]|uniref:Neurogenic locus Notch protein n=1 Tax=Caerostris darwini TaxID=1538125 RepID=A0AAV4QJC0_9ARAC|nr:neurogenic locus Notch protein [Caerostris darwini]